MNGNAEQMNGPAYLDHNASSPMWPEVATTMMDLMRHPGNASSVHGFGRKYRQYVEDAREEVAALVGASAGRVIFTSGGTEANNLALNGCGRSIVLASSIEHDSVLHAGEGIRSLPVGSDGVIDQIRLEAALTEAAEPVVISVMLANNETGVVQPVADVVACAAEHGAIVHTDAVQAAGRIVVDAVGLGVDMVTLSAHKIGGPQGVGALILGRDLPISARIRGGGQERGRRAGTENMAGIAGFGVAARLARENIENMKPVGQLRDEMEKRLRKAIPDVAVFGDKVERLPNTSCFAIPGLRSETQVMALDLAGLAVSAGSACSSGKVTPSHVLRAMGVSETLAGCAIRVSFGQDNRLDDIERLVAELVALYRRVGKRPADAA